MSAHAFLSWKVTNLIRASFVSQPVQEKVNIIRSFSTPLIGDKVESFRRDGKGYVLLRTASPRTSHAVQPSEAADAINPHMSTEFNVDKGEDIHVL